MLFFDGMNPESNALSEVVQKIHCLVHNVLISIQRTQMNAAGVT
jgi:hypothetical protein